MMNPRLPVTRAADTLHSLVKSKIASIKVDSIAQILPSIDMIQQVFPEYTFKTCRLTHPNLPYISQNCERLFGYERDYMSHMDLKQLYAHVPEEDCEDLYKSLLFFQNFLIDLQPENFHEYRTVMHYRFIRNDGKVIFLRDEKASFALSNSQYLYYTTYKDMSRELLFSGIRLAIYSNITGEKITSYRPEHAGPPLSDREGDLLRLIRSGLSTKEMAWHLNISQHTVRNIRQRMFEKFHVSNSIELLNKTAQLG